MKTEKELLDDLENLLDKVHDEVFSDEKYEDIDRDALCIALDDIDRLRVLLKV